MNHPICAFIRIGSTNRHFNGHMIRTAALMPALLAAAAIFLVLAFPVAAQASAKSVVLYNPTSQNEDDWGAPGAGDQFTAQAFLTGDLGIVSSVSIPFEPIGAPGGVFHIELWDDVGGLPGSRIASFGDVDLAALPPGRGPATFDDPITDLEPNSVYYIVSSFVDAEIDTPTQDTVKQFLSRDAEGTRGAGELLVMEVDEWVLVSDLFGTPDESIFQLMTIVESPMGFLGHEVTIGARYYDGSNVQIDLSPFVIATPRVGNGVELEGGIIDLEGGGQIGHGAFDLAAFTIDIDEANLGGFNTDSGNFNGYIIEDKNGTLPDFVAATVDPTVSKRQPKDILVSPNSIWVNDEGISVPPNSFVRLIVTFADASSTPNLSLSTSPNGDVVLEGPAQVGEQYRFEQSADLIDFTPIDKVLTANAPSVMTFIKPSTPQMFYRLKPSE